MKHFAILDDATFTFLLRLRTYNAFWFEALVRCAKKNPRLAKHCLTQLVTTLTQARFDISNVNSFQICRAANCGLLEQGLFDLSLKLPNWTSYLKIREEQMLSQYKPKP